MDHGVIIIDKPAGITSHDVVYRLRKILKTKKIGHTGTLDPFATGVLVMLVGKATRLARFLDGDEKEYEGLFRFGYETDTGDVTGEERGAVAGPEDLERLDREVLRAVLGEFTGEIEQVPPMHSAKKVKGTKLYKLAHKGVEVERKPVAVKIKELELLAGLQINGEEGTVDAKVRVVCSAGTYIRTLAEDIGRRIGIGCHLTELRRTRAGSFGIEDAVTLEELTGEAEDGKAKERLIGMSEAIIQLPAIPLNEEEKERVSNGMRLSYSAGDLEDGTEVRLTMDGELAAVGVYDLNEEAIRPKIVMI